MFALNARVTVLTLSASGTQKVESLYAVNEKGLRAFESSEAFRYLIVSKLLLPQTCVRVHTTVFDTGLEPCGLHSAICRMLFEEIIIVLSLDMLTDDTALIDTMGQRTTAKL